MYPPLPKLTSGYDIVFHVFLPSQISAHWILWQTNTIFRGDVQVPIIELTHSFTLHSIYLFKDKVLSGYPTYSDHLTFWMKNWLSLWFSLLIIFGRQTFVRLTSVTVHYRSTFQLDDNSNWRQICGMRYLLLVFHRPSMHLKLIHFYAIYV